MRGPLFPLRGILGQDSRSPSLSCSPSLPRNFLGQVLSGRPVCRGGRRKVLQRAAGCRAQHPGMVPGQGRLPTQRGGLPGARIVAAGAEGGSRGAELCAASCPLTCFLRYPAGLGGTGHPSLLGDAWRWGSSAFSSRQLSPTSCRRSGAAVRGRFCTARHRAPSGLGRLPRRLPFSFCLHLPLSLSAPLPLTLTLTVCLSV